MATTSIFLKALEQLRTLSLTYQEEQKSFPRPVEDVDDERVRDIRRKPIPSVQTREITEQLEEIQAQIIQVQKWLQAHPELLHLLDSGIRNEVRAMERRLTWTNIALNVFFTVLGAVIGLLLPVLLASIRW